MSRSIGSLVTGLRVRTDSVRNGKGCSAFAREGDTVVLHSMDRLARNLDDLRLIVQKLTKRGVISAPSEICLRLANDPGTGPAGTANRGK